MRPAVRRVRLDPEAFAREKAASGARAAYLAFEGAVACAVGRILTEDGDAVVALGAGHSHFIDPQRYEQVAAAYGARRA